MTGLSSAWSDPHSSLHARTTPPASRRTGKIDSAWNNPADHFSMLFTDVRGVLRHRFALDEVRCGAHARKVAPDVSSPATCSRSRTTTSAPTSVTLRLPTDRRNGIKADTGIFVAGPVDDQAVPRSTRACVTTGSSARVAGERCCRAGSTGGSITGSARTARTIRRRDASGPCSTGRTSQPAHRCRATTCSATARQH